MTYCKFATRKIWVLSLCLLIPEVCFSELQKISDHALSQQIGQSGITIDREVPLSVESITLDLEGSEGVSVITGNPLDSNPYNNRAILNYQYKGLALDILNDGILSVGLPKQFILGQRNPITGNLENGLNASLYLSKTAEIPPTTYRSQAQTYTAYINSTSDDPAHDDFTLSISGDLNRIFNGSYSENLSNSNIDGASVTFSISDPSLINLSVVSEDKRNCDFGPFGCDGTDDGEIILVDSNGDLVAVASVAGEDASLTNISVNPTRSIDNLGSNFFISAKMTGTFDLTGSINIFSGTAVNHRP